jgi:hypothetical protein
MRTEADIVKRPLNGLFKEVKLNRGMPELEMGKVA